jgi:hypothetical protein
LRCECTAFGVMQHCVHLSQVGIQYLMEEPICSLGVEALINPPRYPTSILLSPIKHSSSRCPVPYPDCSRSSNHAAQTVSDTIQGCIDINLPTLESWILNPSFSTRHIPGARQTEKVKIQTRILGRSWRSAPASRSSYYCSASGQRLRGAGQVFRNHSPESRARQFEILSPCFARAAVHHSRY